MIFYKDIINELIHRIYCDACGKELKINIYKKKFPHENSHQGSYWYRGKVNCNECNTENKYKVQIFYSITRGKNVSKVKKGKEKYLNSYKHKISVFCRRCNAFEYTDCKNTSCEFYGIKSFHKTKRTDEDYWWATKLSKVKESHDRFYVTKWKKKTKNESNDSSTIQTTEESSEN